MAIPYKKFTLLKPSKSKVSINRWYGLNYSESIADGELKEMKNVVSDGASLCVRPSREVVASGIENPQKILFCGDKLSYIAGGKLYVDGLGYVGDVGNATTAVDFNNKKMLFYPTDMVYDYQKNTVEQAMETLKKNDCELKIDIGSKGYFYGIILTVDGSNDNEFIHLQPVMENNMPVKDENGKTIYPAISVHCSEDPCFWEGHEQYRRTLFVKAWGLNDDDEEIEITETLPGYHYQMFEFGEKISYEGCYATKLKIYVGYCYSYGSTLKGVNNICLEAKDADYNNGVENDDTIKYWVSPSEYPAPNSRPPIKYACMDNNRVVGVEGNNFYASVLGDYSDWTDFVDADGNPKATGAYAEELYTYGDFTGIVKYRSNVIITKKNAFYECYGNKPPYRINLASNVGCVDNRTIKEVGGSLYFLSAEGVFRYSGGLPVNISKKICGGFGKFVSGFGESDGTKYYLYAQGENKEGLLVYDTINGMWSRQDDGGIIDMASFDNKVYALTKDGGIVKFGGGNEDVLWELETKEFDLNSSVKKIPGKLTLEVDATLGSEMDIYIKYDNGAFERVASYSAFKTNIVDIRLKPKVCDRFQLKLAGRGSVKILSLGCDVISSNKQHNKAFLIRY